jgi:hypothetical protein
VYQTQLELAEAANMSRNAASRLLVEMEADGLVALHYRQLIKRWFEPARVRKRDRAPRPVPRPLRRASPVSAGPNPQGFASATARRGQCRAPCGGPRP